MAKKEIKIKEIETKVKEIREIPRSEKDIGIPKRVVEKRIIEKRTEGTEGSDEEIFEEVSIRTQGKGSNLPRPSLDNLSEEIISRREDSVNRDEDREIIGYSPNKSNPDEREYNATDPNRPNMSSGGFGGDPFRERSMFQENQNFDDRRYYEEKKSGEDNRRRRG